MTTTRYLKLAGFFLAVTLVDLVYTVYVTEGFSSALMVTGFLLAMVFGAIPLFRDLK